MMFCILLCLVVFIRWMVFISYEAPKTIHHEVRVVSIQKKTYQDLVTFVYQGRRYHFHSAHNQFSHNDQLTITGDVAQYRNQTVPNGFNPKIYHLSQGVIGYLKTYQILHHEERFSLWEIRNHVSSYLSRFESGVYLQSYILGEKSFSNDQNETFKDLGILYLFSLSGLHFFGLIQIIRKIMFYLDLRKGNQRIIIVFFYFVMLFLQAFSLTVIRLFIMYLFMEANTYFKWKYTRLDGLFLTFYVMVIMHIPWLFHQGFLLSFLILLMLNLTQDFYRSQSGYLKTLIISSLVFLIILPLYGHLSLLMIFLMPFFVFVLTKPFLWITIITIIWHPMDLLFSKVIHLFERALAVVQSRNFSLHLPTPNVGFLTAYFLLLTYLLCSKSFLSSMKRLTLIVLFYLILFIQNIYWFDAQVYFLDVGQGDATVILSPTCNIVIDSYQYVTPFLKSLGVYRLDFLVLTHSDTDHIREAQRIINEFQVERVVLNPYDDYGLNHSNIHRAQVGEELHCDPYTMRIMGPLRNYHSSNDNSLVVQMKINELVFLFAGDAEQASENEMAFHHQHQLKSDVLKIGHHGSSTSSSQSFLDYVNPRIAVVSVGYDNRFQFPSSEVLHRLALQRVQVFRTDLEGTIIYTVQKKTEKWSKKIPF
ncbi:MAG: ComEC/Rec2 family competence protein [Acholeplasmataceae bacterium]|nr:ComEC/Rec2 family competence protein [Acholeplasmataceae bacterium]